MSNKKKVGIVCDDYKLNKFRSELKEIGVTDFKTSVFDKKKNLITIQIEVDIEKVKEVQRVCEKVEFYFKNRN